MALLLRKLAIFVILFLGFINSYLTAPTTGNTVAVTENSLDSVTVTLIRTCEGKRETLTVPNTQYKCNPVSRSSQLVQSIHTDSADLTLKFFKSADCEGSSFSYNRRTSQVGNFSPRSFMISQ